MFGLKAVLPALARESYDDLAIGDGGAASTALVRLLFEPLADDERHALRRDLCAYCARDTWGLVTFSGVCANLRREPNQNDAREAFQPHDSREPKEIR